MMISFTALVVLSSCASLLVTRLSWLVWPTVFIWGAAGGALYTLAMIDIGSREKGISLVNSTAVLVLTYTLGGLIASAASGALIEWSIQLGFPSLLILVASIGLLTLIRAGRSATT